jgi:CubicO group peptidase (beta-lactamase class C family)
MGRLDTESRRLGAFPLLRQVNAPSLLDMKHLSAVVLVLIATTAEPAPNDSLAFSPARLARAGNLLARAVAGKTAASAVGLIARSGVIAFQAAYGENGPGVPFDTRAIVRLSSMTKPLTAVAVLSLYEKGVLQLGDPVQKFLPEFAQCRVGPERVALDRPITIYDLLTHQAGLVPDGNDELNHIWDTAATAREFSQALARVPLRFQPGSQFEYGPSYEVLSALVEQATHRSFKDVMTEEVLEPLKMHDTHFFVPKDKQARLALPYTQETPSEFFSGGGGLRSTVGDYYRFGQFLLNEGELDGVRVLSPHTVRLMRTDHVGAKFSELGYGWGLGGAVRTSAAAPDLESPGTFGWNGGTGTLFLIDPVEQMVVVVFIPSTPGSEGIDDLKNAFVTAAYQAIVSPPHPPRAH